MTPYLSTDTGLLVPPSRNGHAYPESSRYALMADLYEATITDLRIQLQEQGWLRLSELGSEQFGRDTIGQIVAWSRAAYLKNPLVNRAVECGALYVWGQDLSVNAADAVKPAIDRFWNANRATLTGQQASRLLEVELEVTGNLFLALFVGVPGPGEVAVRMVPVEEITDVVGNPDDRAEVWYYRRRWTQKSSDGTTTQTATTYHPDWNYRPENRPETIGLPSGETVPVRWDAPIAHTRVGAFAHWMWGVPEVYGALDWAKAYTDMQSDLVSRSRSLTKFAFTLTTTGGAAGVAAAKAKIATTLGTATPETNPPPVAGSAFVRGTKDQSIDPINLSAANLPSDNARPIRLYASAALGIPDHFFDSDTANYATAATLDRPTELRFAERRRLWVDLLTELCQWVIDRDLEAPGGLIRGTPTGDERKVSLDFPDLLERDVVARVGAVVDAATLKGSADAGTMPEELRTRLLLGALNVEDIDAAIAQLATEKAERERKAAEIAKQTARQPPPAAQPNGNQPTNGRVPIPESIRSIAEVSDDGTLTLSDILAIQQWFDETVPQYAGILNAQIITEDDDGGS